MCFVWYNQQAVICMNENPCQLTLRLPWILILFVLV